MRDPIRYDKRAIPNDEGGATLNMQSMPQVMTSASPFDLVI
jgi:hypothetical protein